MFVLGKVSGVFPKRVRLCSRHDNGPKFTFPLCFLVAIGTYKFSASIYYAFFSHSPLKAPLIEVQFLPFH